MRDRPLSLTQFGISPYRYKELKYFCLQYYEYRKKYSEIEFDISAAQFSEIKTGDKADKTANLAIKRQELWEKMKKIEQAAMKADGEIYEYILKNVTKGMGYQYLGVPCGERQFYERRRLFYCILDKMV